MAGMIIANYTLKIHDNFWSHVKADSYYKGHPQGENVSQAPKGTLLEIENLPKFRLQMNIICYRFHIKTPFTF